MSTGLEPFSAPDRPSREPKARGPGRATEIERRLRSQGTGAETLAKTGLTLSIEYKNSRLFQGYSTGLVRGTGYKRGRHLRASPQESSTVLSSSRPVLSIHLLEVASPSSANSSRELSP